MFQLTSKEWTALKSQSVISNVEDTGNKEDNRSQSATGSRGGRRTPPFAFTEHGAIMAASVLNSPETVAMSVFVVRAFVQMRERLVANAQIIRRLAEIDKTLLEHDQVLGTIWQQLQPLLEPASDPPKRKIGFDFNGESE